MSRNYLFLFILRSLLLILLLGAGHVVFSQRQAMNFSHLGKEQGLSQNNVNCILQDSRGFMWFGTRDGLNRYDGYDFKVYKNITDDPSSIGNNNITSMVEGSSGELWIGTSGGGLNRLDRQKDLFTHYNEDKKSKKGLTDHFINCLMLDCHGNLWIGTNEGGLDILNPVTGEVSNYAYGRDSNSLSDNSIKHIFEDSRRRVWISTSSGGLDLFDSNSHRFTRFQHNEKDSKTIASNMVQEVFEDSRQRIWIGTNAGLDLLDPKQNIFYHYKNDPADKTSLTQNNVVALEEDNNGNLWAGTDNEGISILNPDSKSFHSLLHDPVDNSSPASNSICSIYKDRRGNMWVGTFCNGIDVDNSDANKFTHYMHQSSPNSLANNNVLDLFEDSGKNLWVGTDGGGLELLDRKTGDFRHFRHNPADKNSISGNYVLTLHEDKDRNLWAGTWGDGITVIDKTRSRFHYYKNDPADSSSLSSNNIYAITEDMDKSIWVGSFGGGLNLFDPGKKGFIRYKHDLDDPNSLVSNNVNALLGDRKGWLWIGTSGSGVDRFDKKTKIFTHFRHDAGRNSLSNNSINALYEDKRGNIWICTCAGLNRIDGHTGLFTVYGTKDGLPNEVIYGILEDDKGYIWVSTGNGLSKFDPRKKTFANFSVADGVQSSEFKPHSAYKSPSGALYFGGINGFNEFFPDSIRANPFEPPLLVTGFQIFNKEVSASDGQEATGPLTSDITETKEITLSYKQSVISFAFASLNYTAPEKKQYAYMLEGFDKKWNYIGMRRTATYTNLDAGKYIFKVRGLNNDGTWSPGFTAIQLIITPPFWQAWWFRVLALLLVTGGAVSVYRVRTGKIRAQRTELETQVQERTGQLTISITEERKARQEAELANGDAEKARLEAEKANRAKSVFLATMSHEIRTPMNGVLGMASLLAETTLTEEQEDYTDTIRNCGETLMNVINDILDFSKIESCKMELEQKSFDLRTCIEEVLDVFAGKAGQAGLDLVYQIDHNVPSKIIGDDMRIRQILMNLVGNAIKFTQKGEVFVSVHLSSAGTGGEIILSFEIKDTGIGIPADKVDRLFQAFSQVDSSTTRKYGGTGLGLVISEKLIHLMGGVIEVTSQPGKGTTFIFTLPTRASSDSIRSYVNMAGLERKEVLVVDDNLTNRNILQNLLRQWKLTPTLATSGREALAILSQRPDFDLVISDLQMPEMDGIVLAETIRKKYARVPIILLSSVGNERGKYEPDLFRSVLTKPVKQQVLFEHVRNALKQPEGGISLRLKQLSRHLLSANLATKYPLNILVAEDNPINQKLIIHILNKLGYEPDAVENGFEALEATREKNYDLILMDVQMPEMDGLEATIAIRMRAKEQPVIIALTANAMQGDREQCLNSGMEDYMSKPVQLEDLVNLIEKWALQIGKRKNA
ncbi:MAG TPA: two-component regulator propeller domain-containing protein [Puia sp.]|nr:two-component regulator propeller domain-containing protein [Puia sp.]